MTASLELVDQAYDKVRRLSHLRNAGVLGGAGLIPAVDGLVNQLKKSGELDTEFTHHLSDAGIDATLEIVLFRIIQELVNNVLKHANATELQIDITHHDGHIAIMIEDDGVGMNTYSRDAAGLGLHSIEKKVEQYDGHLEIDSHIGHGTTVSIEIPLYENTYYTS